MARKIFSTVLIAWLCSLQLSSSRKLPGNNVLTSGNLILSQKDGTSSLNLKALFNGARKVEGELGISLPEAVGQPTDCTSSPGVQCLEWGDYARVLITDASTTTDNCARVEWTSTFARRLEDCYDLDPVDVWYGGGETFRQFWPIDGEVRPEAPFVTGDFLQNRDVYYGGVVENYWLVSSGSAISVDEDTPLFLSVNSVHPNKICYIAQDEHPFKARSELSLKYSICLGDNLKEVHQRSIQKFYSRPTEIPDETMLLRPFWSTWAQYKVDVNQSIVLDYAQKIRDSGFDLNSHVEIDDHWETCYGEAEFNPIKFPNPTAMVQQLKALDFKVTLWIHPFINFDCPSFNTAFDNNHFVRDPKNKTGITWWWQGANSGVIDFSEPNARDWWNARLRKLQTEVGIDSYKFDAGETNWLPSAAKLNSDDNLLPNSYTTHYVNNVASFGGMIEVRSARRNQAQPIFVRMLDKDSVWGYDNGLKSLIPTLLHIGILGYPFVLPDMIGGNAYGDLPSKELYIRWMQANAFMASVQFSIAPWNYDAQVVSFTKSILALREQYKDEILAAAHQATVDGTPMNRPMWWVDPTDPETYSIDSQYMLGDEILVAPILDEGSTRRDIYLPVGNWVGGFDQIVYNGPTWLRDYNAPIDVVPYFIKTAF